MSKGFVAPRCRSADSPDVLATAHAALHRFGECGSQMLATTAEMPVCARAARRAASIRLTQSSVAITFRPVCSAQSARVRRTVRDYCALPAETPCCTHSRHSSGYVQESLIWRMELRHDVTSLTPMLPSPHHTHAGTVRPRAAMLALPAPSYSAFTKRTDLVGLVPYTTHDRNSTTQSFSAPESPSTFLHSTTHITLCSPDPAHNGPPAFPAFTNL
jgi:hypothetical protein